MCCDQVRTPALTPCGHLFCSSCLAECLNIKPSCPVCTAPTRPIEARPCPPLVRLQETLRGLREKALEAEVGRLFGDPSPSAPLPPLEATLRRLLQSSVSAYLDYDKDLQQRHEQQLAALRALPLDPRERARRGAELEEARARATTLLIAALEEHVAQVAPPPRLLPSVVTVLIPSLGDLRLEDVQLQPTDTPAELRALIAQRLERLGDPVHEWAPHNVFRVQGVGLPQEGRLVGEGQAVVPPPGGVVEVQGRLVTKRGAPKVCFKTTWARTEGQGMVHSEDYATCRACKLNWVCASCAATCHAPLGHEVLPYLKGHHPTWACCYCAKSGLCRLLPHS